MATTIDELIVRIKADTAELEKGLNKVKGRVNAADTETKKLGGTFRSLRGPIASVIATMAGFALAANKIKNVGMQFEDLQSSLNAVFGSVTAGKQAFDDIKAFAQETPFQLETATQAFINLKASGIEPNIGQLKTFANVASVATDSVGAFEALVRVTQRASQGAVQLEELNILADRGIPVFTALENQLKITRDEVTEFGSTSEGAAEIMDALTKGLQEITGDAMALKMDNLSVKTSNLEIALKGVAQAIFEEGGLGEAFKQFTDQAIRDVDTLTIKLKSLFTGAPEEFFTATTDEERLKILEKESQRLRGLVKDAGGGSGQGMHNFFNDPLGTIGGMLGIGDNVAVLEERATGLEVLMRQIRANINAENERKAAIEAGAGADNADADAKKARRDAVSQLTKIMDKNKDKAVELQAAIALVESELNRVLGGEDSKFAESDLQRVLTVLQEDLKALGDTDTSDLGALKEVILETSNAFTNDFVQSLMNGQKALVSFRDFAKSLVSQIITIFLQLEVVNKIINAVLGLEGDARLDSGGIFTERGSAGGGTVQRGAATLVGERGPEIFVPHSAGVIRNNHDSRNMMGGSAVVINQSVNFATGVVPTVRAEVAKMLPDISDVTKAAVLEASARGGSFRRGLLGG